MASTRNKSENLKQKSRVLIALGLVTLTGSTGFGQAPVAPSSLPAFIPVANQPAAVKIASGPLKKDTALKRTSNSTNASASLPAPEAAESLPALGATAPALASAAPSREQVLEARLRELEADAAGKSAREVELEERLKNLERFLSRPEMTASTSLEAQQPPTAPATGTMDSRDDDLPPGEEAYVPVGVDPPGGPASPPVANEFGVPGEGKPQMPYTPKLKKGYAGIGPGFVISTDDDEYQLQFHNLTQFELRQYNNQNMNPTHSTFDFPRQRLIFNGRLTKPIEYFIATNWGINNLALLDCFVNLHYDDRIQFKLGRFKTPFAYEFYAEPSTWLISPERSVFFNNYGPNRDVGAMVWGQIFDKTADYAAGVFNGVRSGNVDNNNAKQAMGYFNIRPFEKAGIDQLKHWNVGGSASYNVYNGSARPEVFRTNVPYPGDPNVSPQFLTLNNNVWEFGTQNLWAIHSAYFYKSLSVIGEYMAGFETYAKQTSLTKGTHVPMNGWYIQGAYFLTGEHVNSRGMVAPLRPFNPKGWSGFGAVELTGRFANQTTDKSIFNFAQVSKWTNDVNVIDVGVNWYWSSYLKFYLGWQRALYGEPIQAAPGLKSSSPPSYWMSSTDMLWLRAQIYY